MNILIVDDEEIRIKPIKEFLEMADHKVTIIGSIKKAFEFFIENAKIIDIIVLDVMMRMDEEDKGMTVKGYKIDEKKAELGFSTGVVFWRFLNDVISYSNKKIPIVFFSARVDLESQFPELSKAKQEGTIDILRKPMRLDEFEKKLEEIYCTFNSTK